MEIILSLTQQQIAKSKLFNIELNCLRNIPLTKYDLWKVKLHQYLISRFLGILHLQILENIKICF